MHIGVGGNLPCEDKPVTTRHGLMQASLIALMIAIPLAITTAAQADNIAQPAIAPITEIDVLSVINQTAASRNPDIAPPALPDVNVTGALSSPQAAIQISIAPPDLPQPAPALGATAKTPLQLALGEILTSTSLPARFTKTQREALVAFYRTRDDAPLWLDGKAWSSQARDILTTLAKAGEDGLNPPDYTAPLVDPLPHDGQARILAEADLRLSALAVLYARDARGGRIDPRQVSKLMTPKLALPNAGDVLDTLATSKNAGAALATYQPVHADYERLKRALGALRASRPTLPLVNVPQGPLIKLGMRDARVPLVRARFGLGPMSDPDAATTYDERVASAVADFQRNKGLPASGMLTRQTVAALGNNSSLRQEADIIANMERWRWLPSELGERHIFVNIPAFTMKVMSSGTMLHSARVIVGKTETQTPIFSDEMRHVILNPSWYVPPSIMKNEFLPKLAQNPNYAAERGYEVIRNGNAISVRQPPGERNALGNIKFMFPNEHAVYLHDTPGRHLFAKTARALSHGCVRVDQPMRLAQILLGPEWTEARLKSLVGQGERLVKLPRIVPVHLAYFTLSADSEGQLTRIEDIYGIDRRLAEALGYRS
jgi:L,D-transpeptidase YcbB